MQRFASNDDPSWSSRCEDGTSMATTTALALTAVPQLAQTLVPLGFQIPQCAQNIQ
jgi:hypothetical protein